MGGFGDLFGGLFDALGELGVFEAVKGGIEAAGDSGGDKPAFDAAAVYERVLAGGSRDLNVNDQ